MAFADLTNAPADDSIYLISKRLRRLDGRTRFLKTGCRITKIAIVTDSNSGIFERQARKMGVYVVPMPFSINGQWLYEGVQLTAKDFYKAQAEGADITTSMPSPADVTGM